MEENIEIKKVFALKAIRPYAKDPSTCGASATGACLNLTVEGKMCVAGKHLLPEVREKYRSGSISSILTDYQFKQDQVFIPEAVNILDMNQWQVLQGIHDTIARLHIINTHPLDTGYNRGRLEKDLLDSCNKLGLFTYEEMMDFSTV